MSSRWYPLYQRGNPQLRVFLPNFWLKLVRPSHEQPKNVITNILLVIQYLFKYFILNLLIPGCPVFMLNADDQIRRKELPRKDLQAECP